jgi:uncharacterized alkaline shock family protein YloU
MPAPESESGKSELLPSLPQSSSRKDGTTTISDQVVAKIAGIAAREVEGVHELTATGFSGAISGMANKVSGGDAHDYGVRVEVGQQETVINLGMVINYGSSIPKVAHAVRRSISNQIQEMTGLQTREVNIAVTDIAFPEKTSTVHQIR